MGNKSKNYEVLYFMTNFKLSFKNKTKNQTWVYLVLFGTAIYMYVANKLVN